MNEPCLCGDPVCKNCYPDYNFDDLDAWNENADMAMRDFWKERYVPTTQPHIDWDEIREAEVNDPSGLMKRQAC